MFCIVDGQLQARTVDLTGISDPGVLGQDSAERHYPVPEPFRFWSFELISGRSTTKIIFGTEWPKNTNDHISNKVVSVTTRTVRGCSAEAWSGLHLGRKEIIFYSPISGISQNIICFVRGLFNMFQCELWIKPYKSLSLSDLRLSQISETLDPKCVGDFVMAVFGDRIIM